MLALNPDISRCKSILSLEKVNFEGEETSEELQGIYTLGLLSEPSFITVSSQQNRAETLAVALDRMNTSIKPCKVLIIGGGFSGISFATKLRKLSSDSSKYEISILEKGSMFCHLQNMCTTRRLHPNVHKWPNNNWAEEKRIAFDESEIEWSADTADRVAKKFKTKLYELNNDSNDFKMYLFCKNVIFKKSGSRFDVSFSGKRIHNDHDKNFDASFYSEGVDVIIVCSGYGIENRHEADTKIALLASNSSYWRNDTFGQTNLTQNTETYLISGSGDGALVDLFRLVISDYYQDESLKELIPLHLDLKYFEKISADENDSDVDELFSKYQEFVERIKWFGSYPRNPGESLFYFLEKFFKDNDQVYQVFVQNFRATIKDEVKCILHVIAGDGKNKIERIVDDIRVTFYNRILFYFTYAFADVEVVMTVDPSKSSFEIDRLIKLYNISERNVIVRHGVNKKLSIKDLLADSGYKMKEENNQSILEHAIKYKSGDKFSDVLL